jgi:hypothetical protein
MHQKKKKKKKTYTMQQLILTLISSSSSSFFFFFHFFFSPISSFLPTKKVLAVGLAVTHDWLDPRLDSPGHPLSVNLPLLGFRFNPKTIFVALKTIFVTLETNFGH